MDTVRIFDSFLFKENKKKGNCILHFTARKIIYSGYIS